VTLYCYGLGDGSIWNTDDALYGHVVREMVESHRFTLPQWFDYDLAGAYPLGVSWMALIARVTGPSLLGLQVAAVLAAFACFVALARLGGRVGLYAGAMLVVQPLFFLFSQRVMHDCLLAALTVAAVALYHRAEGRASYLVGAGAACAAASLVKIGAGLLPLGILGLHAILFSRPLLRRPALWTAILIAIGAPLGWLAIHGSVGPIVGSFFRRVFVGFEGHGPAGGAEEGPSVAAGSLAATLLGSGMVTQILVALGAAGSIVAARRRDALDHLALVWWAVAAGAIASMRTYLPQYAIQVLLPTCLLAGIAVDAALRRVPWAEPLAAAGLLAAMASTAPLFDYAHHADDRIAVLARLQAARASDTLLCTIDVYHAASVFYTARKVVYLTEHERARRILRRVFGEDTVPTVQAGELPRVLDRAPGVSCIVARAAVGPLLARLDGSYRIVEASAAVLGPDVVLLER
jgi:4-amino-4-deoxy-L-arabinose transferase-like glycosyltransferase